jgi:hypothetical protein
MLVEQASNDPHPVDIPAASLSLADRSTAMESLRFSPLTIIFAYFSSGTGARRGQARPESVADDAPRRSPFTAVMHSFSLL